MTKKDIKRVEEGFDEREKYKYERLKELLIHKEQIEREIKEIINE